MPEADRAHRRIRRTAIVIAAVLIGLDLAACAPRRHSGMVVDPVTGLQYGSTVERNLVVDASQFEDRRLKLRIRNSSGDPAFDLGAFRGALEGAYRDKGFQPVAGDAFGVLLDVNVLYSGQTSEGLVREYAFLGTAAGGAGGYYAAGEPAAVVGLIAGASLGAILGSYVTDDTYIVVAEVTLAVPDGRTGTVERTIQFGADAKTETEPAGLRRFEQQIRTGVAVYAGGRNVNQQEIADDVRQRFRRILTDVI